MFRAKYVTLMTYTNITLAILMIRKNDGKIYVIFEIKTGSC